MAAVRQNQRIAFANFHGVPQLERRAMTGDRAQGCEWVRCSRGAVLCVAVGVSKRPWSALCAKHAKVFPWARKRELPKEKYRNAVTS